MSAEGEHHYAEMWISVRYMLYSAGSDVFDLFLNSNEHLYLSDQSIFIPFLYHLRGSAEGALSTFVSR